MFFFSFSPSENRTSVAGLQLGVGERFLSDTRSFVQVNWIDSEFLHTAAGDDTHVHADRPTFGRQKAKPPDGHLAQHQPK